MESIPNTTQIKPIRKNYQNYYRIKQDRNKNSEQNKMAWKKTRQTPTLPSQSANPPPPTHTPEDLGPLGPPMNRVGGCDSK